MPYTEAQPAVRSALYVVHATLTTSKGPQHVHRRVRATSARAAVRRMRKAFPGCTVHAGVHEHGTCDACRWHGYHVLD